MRPVPTWDKYFLDIARATALRSKDPSTQVGAVLVDEDGHIIGTGYNGFPPNFPELPESWERPAKYDYVVHAEANCLLHTIKSTKGSILYTTMFPCKECAKLIAAARIKKVVYSDDAYKNEVSQIIFAQCKIELAKLGD